MRPRIRTLKPEHKVHRKVGPLSHSAYRLWVGLITEADDDGRLVGDLAQLRALIFPYHALSLGKLEAHVAELQHVGLIQRYECEGIPYISFPSWSDHQRSDSYHYRQSILPTPPPFTHQSLNGDSVEAHRNPPPTSSSSSGNSSGNTTVEHRSTARRLLEFLNQKAGRRHREVPATLEPIMARLRDGATEQECRGVIARKIREWQGDPKMAKYLRPETLFNRTKFESYLGERTTEVPHAPVPPVQ